jgi:type IV secretion system protein TrbG
MRRKIFAVLFLCALVLASCSTTGGTTAVTKPSTDGVQIITVQDWSNAKTEMPITAVIEPEDLVTSPVINIETLKADESAMQSSVKSSTLEQQVRKEEIQEAVKTDPLANTDLDDSLYGTSSGALATQATENSFTYITSTANFTGAIATYDYIEGHIYEVITSPKAITDFRLKPGESISGSPIVNNDSTSWQFTMGTSVENGQTVQHLFIKPTTVGLDTSMIVLTDQRTYYFRIASFENSYMTALRFNYPVDSGQGYFIAEDFDAFTKEATTAVDESVYKLDLSKAEYNYTIKKLRGTPTWTPQNVFSDDKKTYIQLPVSILSSDELPSVYIQKGDEEALVNYRIIGNIYQLDTVITDAQSILLKSGENEQVKITRSK